MTVLLTVAALIAATVGTVLVTQSWSPIPTLNQLPLPARSNTTDRSVDTPDYIWECFGICPYDKTVRPGTAPTWVLMGSWLPSGLLTLIEGANGGDFLVLQYGNEPLRTKQIQNMAAAASMPLNSVSTIVLKQMAADSNLWILTRIASAEAILLVGEDSGNFLGWADTRIQESVQNVTSRSRRALGAVGTAMSVFGRHVFHGQIASPEALSSPLSSRIALSEHALFDSPFADWIIDPFVVARDRLGRLVTFVARAVKDFGAHTPRLGAIGLDTQTCLFVTANVPNAIAQTCSAGDLYLLVFDTDAEIVHEASPLTFTNIRATRVAQEGVSWPWSSTGGVGDQYGLNVVDGAFLEEYPYGVGGPEPGPPETSHEP